MRNHPENKKPWTILKLINWGTEYFESKKIDSPRNTSEILLSLILNIKKIDLYLQFDKPLTQSELSKFKALLHRRIKGEPVAYISGNKGFWKHKFEVSKHTLIPRPDTECLVENTLKIFSSKIGSNNKKILELGTGTGAVILSLAMEYLDNFFFATDLSGKAIEVAKKNAQNNLIDNKIIFLRGNWFEPFKPGKYYFDVIISNPPYIPSDQIKLLQPEIVNYEPLLALDGGEKGLDAIEHIIKSAKTYLNKNGYLMLEIGYDQKEPVKKIIEMVNDYKNIEFINDYTGNNRVVKMQKK